MRPQHAPASAAWVLEGPLAKDGTDLSGEAPTTSGTLLGDVWAILVGKNLLRPPKAREPHMRFRLKHVVKREHEDEDEDGEPGAQQGGRKSARLSLKRARNLG